MRRLLVRVRVQLRRHEVARGRPQLAALPNSAMAHFMSQPACGASVASSCCGQYVT
jgi:hypothetical protein